MDINKLKEKYHHNPDLVIKEIKYKKKIIYIIFIETICSSDRINNYILKGISNYILDKRVIKDFKNFLSSPKIIDISEDKINYYLNNSFTIIIKDKDIYAIETRADLDRSVTDAKIESNLVGPKDSLTENFQKNIGLIKKRIKTEDLISEELLIGNDTKTKVGIIYLNSLVDKDLLIETRIKLKTIKLDYVLEVSNLRNYLIESNSLFPLISLTERPDTVCKNLFKGKIVILCDNSPDALILPAYFIEFINPTGDDYSKPNNVTIIKLLRLLAFLISLLLPALYIALINYNPESIPPNLLLNFATQRSNVPVPAIVEAFIMLFICEILKECDIRFPSSYGSSVSILGALILGEASVSAGLVSPIMIIIIALTFITGLMFSDLNFKTALRNWSYFLLIIASLLGLYGIALGLIVFFTHLVSIKLGKYSYLYPIIPFNKEDVINEVIESNEAQK